MVNHLNFQAPWRPELQLRRREHLLLELRAEGSRHRRQVSRLRPDLLQAQRQRLQRILGQRSPRENHQRASEVLSHQAEGSGNDDDRETGSAAAARFEDRDGGKFKLGLGVALASGLALVHVVPVSGLILESFYVKPRRVALGASLGRVYSL